MRLKRFAPYSHTNSNLHFAENYTLVLEYPKSFSPKVSILGHYFAQYYCPKSFGFHSGIHKPFPECQKLVTAMSFSKISEIVDLTEGTPKGPKPYGVGGDRTWCATFNNYTSEDLTKFIAAAEAHCVSCVIAKENGKEGTPHLQCCFTFNCPRRLKWIHVNFDTSKQGHWEVARNRVEAFNYCFKEDPSPFTLNYKRQGKRTDLDGLYTKLEGGAGMSEVLASRPSYQHIQISRVVLNHKLSTSRPIAPRRVLWFCGPTGKGKSATAYAMGTPEEVYPLSIRDNSETIWWDLYTGQKIVLLDDWRPKKVGFLTLLSLTDRYPIRAQVKGGMIYANYDTLVITAPREPAFYFQDASAEDYEQLRRRISHIVKFPASQEVLEAAGLPFADVVLHEHQEPLLGLGLSTSSPPPLTSTPSPTTLPMTRTTSDLSDHLSSDDPTLFATCFTVGSSPDPPQKPFCSDSAPIAKATSGSAPVTSWDLKSWVSGVCQLPEGPRPAPSSTLKRKLSRRPTLNLTAKEPVKTPLLTWNSLWKSAPAPPELDAFAKAVADADD